MGQILTQELQAVEQSTAKQIDLSILAISIDLATASLMRFSAQVAKLGGEGELASTLGAFSAAMLQSFNALGQALDNGSDKTQIFVAAANALSTVIAGFSAVLEADTKEE